MGSYNMDSHNVQRYVDADGHARNEGDIQVSPGGPYPISYRAIVPKEAECTNLLVPVCLSSSHIAYGSIRMEPVFMILGQSAATAAVAGDRPGHRRSRRSPTRTCRTGCSPTARCSTCPTPPPTGQRHAAKSLPGIVIDDTRAELTGNWGSSSVLDPFVDLGYRHDGDADKGTKSATFRTELNPGRYEVRIAYSPSSNRAKSVPVKIQHKDGTETVTIDQTRPLKDGELFVSIGTFTFGDRATVEVRNDGTSGHVIVDAVQFLPRDR